MDRDICMSWRCLVIGDTQNMSRVTWGGVEHMETSIYKGKVLGDELAVYISGVAYFCVPPFRGLCN